MFAPPVAKPKAKTASNNKTILHRAAPLGQRHADAELAQMLRRLPQGGVSQAHDATGQDSGEARASAKARPPRPSWNFSNVPAYSPGREMLSQRPPVFPAPRLPIQAKLKVGAVNDPLEHEADRVAEQVMRMPAPGAALTPAPPQISRKCDKCEEEEKLQKKEAGPQAATSDAPASVHEVLRSPGQPLDAGTRAYFEPRFGRDFSGVRVHTDAAAAESARDVNAYAYTVGRNMVFDAGRFAPGSQEERRLIAHELTHVVQQSGSDGIRVDRSDERRGLSPIFNKSSEKRIMRMGFESTIEICQRVLKSRHFEVTKGGLRVVLILKKLDKNIPDCRDFDFRVTLTRPKSWWFDKEIANCEASTGGTRSFSFGNLSPGAYYLTISRNFDNPNCCLEGDFLVFDEAVSNDSGGCTRNKELSTMDIVHNALDLAGFIPVLGAIPDGVNAAIYVAQGDWANAGLSAVAMVPVWGDGVKLAEMGGKTVIKISEKAAFRLGEEGIAKGLKEVKAASKVEKATIETTEEAAKAVKAEKGVAQETAKAEKGATEEATKAEKKEAEEAAEAEKKKKEKQKEEKEEKEEKKKSRKCSNAVVETLNAAMHVYCDKPRGCSMQGDTCISATAKVAAGYGCVDARKKLQQKCFSPGDPGYENHMRQLAQAYAALRNCEKVMAAKCR